MSDKWFYFASNFNFPDQPGGGAALARDIVPLLEELTRDRCTSRWMYKEHHGRPEFGRVIMAVDLTDIARSDYIVAFPLTPTSLGLDVPVYLYAPNGRDPTAFDQACLPLKDLIGEKGVGLIRQELEDAKR